VARNLGLPDTVDRMLLQGVGCAGGLAIMRAAAQIACGATALDKPARVLAYACELCTSNVRREMAQAEACDDPAKVGIAGALFSDAAAAFVLCNEHGMLRQDDDGRDGGRGRGRGILNDSGGRWKPLFQLLEWGHLTIPGTVQHMGVFARPLGLTTILTRDVPRLTKVVIRTLLEQLLPSCREKVGVESLHVLDFDRTLHPGGEAIINGAQKMLGLTDQQLRATRLIYKTRGNSASPAVLTVLDLLRSMGRGKDHIVATSFGTGLAIEMSLLRRCRQSSEG
jgi:type III polyketide synthase